MSNSSQPHLLMIGGWDETIRTALSSGFEVSYFGPTSPGQGPGAKTLKLCRNVREAAIDRIGFCLALAKEIHAETPFTASVSFVEPGLETAAVIAEAFGIRGSGLWPVVATRYKDRMRAVLDDHPKLGLGWRNLGDAEDLREFYDRSGPAIIVKPIAGVGSVGVRQIRSLSELEAFSQGFDWSESSSYLAEELVDSDELYSVESLTVDGQHFVLAFSMSKIVGYPFSLQNYIMMPPPQPFDDERGRRIARFVQEFLTAMGLHWGAAHTEVKVSASGRLGIIESQTRVGGDRIWSMTRLTTGIDQIAAAFQSLQNQAETPPHLPPSQGVAVFACILAPAGTVRDVADSTDLYAIEGLLEVSIRIEPGQKLTPLTDNEQRRGYVFLHGANHEEVFKRMRQLSELYWVSYEDGTVWHPTFEIQP